MKHLISILLLCITFVSCVTSPSNTALDELKLLGQKMGKVDRVGYSYSINTDLSYDGKSNLTGKIHFESNSQDSILGMKYICELDMYKMLYNEGVQIIMCKADSSVFKRPLVEFGDGHGNEYPYVAMSYCAIKLFLTDPNIGTEIDSLTRKDTIFGSQACTYFSFWANEKFVDYHKGFNKFSKKVELIFQNSNSLPVYFSQKKIIPRPDNTDYIFHEVVFSNYNFNEQYPASAFNIESVPDYYSWTKRNFSKSLLVNNTIAPDWILPVVNGDSLTLSSLRGKYVLLDFWFIGCGACKQSNPTLIELQQKYGSNNLVVLGVNCYSKDESKIATYCSNMKMNFENVWDGDKITKAYGITAAPIFYLISPQGQIVYSQLGGDTERLKSSVGAFLK